MTWGGKAEWYDQRARIYTHPYIPCYPSCIPHLTAECEFPFLLRALGTANLLLLQPLDSATRLISHHCVWLTGMLYAYLNWIILIVTSVASIYLHSQPLWPVTSSSHYPLLCFSKIVPLLYLIAITPGGLLTLGFVLSMMGDIFLLPQPPTSATSSIESLSFITGLVCFALSHVMYLLIFIRRVGTITILSHFKIWIVLSLYAFGLFSVLKPHLPADLLVPVLCYAALLSSMTCQALSLYLIKPSEETRSCAIGGLCFLVSDSILAWNKFISPVPFNFVLVLGTYYAAQIGIGGLVRGDVKTVVEKKRK